jgi:hypothetical protein
LRLSRRFSRSLLDRGGRGIARSKRDDDGQSHGSKKRIAGVSWPAVSRTCAARIAGSWICVGHCFLLFFSGGTTGRSSEFQLSKANFVQCIGMPVSTGTAPQNTAARRSPNGLAMKTSGFTRSLRPRPPPVLIETFTGTPGARRPALPLLSASDAIANLTV